GGLIHGLARGMAIKDALQCAVDWGAFAVASESSIPSVALKNWLKQPH
ncbi:MAG: PfkB family carbohydrate kinase, partial [Aeromonas veronii]